MKPALTLSVAVETARTAFKTFRRDHASSFDGSDTQPFLVIGSGREGVPNVTFLEGDRPSGIRIENCAQSAQMDVRHMLATPTLRKTGTYGRSIAIRAKRFIWAAEGFPNDDLALGFLTKAAIAAGDLENAEYIDD